MTIGDMYDPLKLSELIRQCWRQDENFSCETSCPLFGTGETDGRICISRLMERSANMIELLSEKVKEHEKKGVLTENDSCGH